MQNALSSAHYFVFVFFNFCNSVLLLADGEAQSLSKTALLNVNVLNCVPSVAALAQVSV